jgi:hypothetical protein
MRETNGIWVVWKPEKKLLVEVSVLTATTLLWALAMGICTLDTISKKLKLILLSTWEARRTPTVSLTNLKQPALREMKRMDLLELEEAEWQQSPQFRWALSLQKAMLL